MLEASLEPQRVLFQLLESTGSLETPLEPQGRLSLLHSASGPSVQSAVHPLGEGESSIGPFQAGISEDVTWCFFFTARASGINASLHSRQVTLEATTSRKRLCQEKWLVQLLAGGVDYREDEISSPSLTVYPNLSAASLLENTLRWANLSRK